MSAEPTVTAQKTRAILERQMWEALSAEERKRYRSLRDFVGQVDTSTSIYETGMRSRLLLAGDRADIFWRKIDAEGMPLATATRLLRDSEVRWRKEQSKRSLDAVIDEVVHAYESNGHERIVGDRVIRTRDTLRQRASRIAKRESAPPPPTLTNGKSPHRARSRQAIREAVAAWISGALPKNDDRGEKFVDDCMREIDAVLDSFTSRFRPAKVDRERLRQACDLLNVPRPKWGSRADQTRAWKHRKAALAATHPDALGHDGARDAFQAFNDAYNTIVTYNDNLAGSAAQGG